MPSAVLAAPDFSAVPPPIALPDTSDPGGSETAAVTLPPAGKLFGFSDALSVVPPSGNEYAGPGLTPDVQAAHAAGAGANSLRIGVSWKSVEPVPGSYDDGSLAWIGRLVEAVRARGGQPLLLLGHPPDWAANASVSYGTAGLRDAPAVIAAFGRFAAHVVRYFGSDIAGVETWNEPNYSTDWGGSQISSAPVYARAHIAAHDAIKAVAPDVDVILGGLAMATSDRSDVDGAGVWATTFWPQKYLLDMYAAGLRPWHYDGVAIHPYPAQYGYSVLPFAQGSILAAAWNDVLRALDWAHEGRAPARIWVTETGVTTSGCQTDGPYCRYPGASGLLGCGRLLQPRCKPWLQLAADQGAQREALVRLVRKFLSNPRVDAVFVHKQYDRWELPQRYANRGFGVIEARPDNGGTVMRVKAAYCALRALRESPPPAPECPDQSASGGSSGSLLGRLGGLLGR